jgi:ribulose-5-phosphate 4-epimerase/fuculose-1-phosphate aldolase
MADGNAESPVRDAVSEDEWKQRIDLAALFRISEYYGWDDHLFTHSSARVPGADNHFLINPMSRCYEEITASGLQKFDQTGELALSHAEPAHGFAIKIHLAIYDAIPEAGCVIHLHSKYSAAVSMQEDGLAPISQFALMAGSVGYHDYEGLFPKPGEFERMADNFKGHKILVLRNHGILVWGRRIEDTFLTAYNLEKAAEAQITAMSGGANIRALPQARIKATMGESATIHSGNDGRLANMSWGAVLRKLDRIDPGYRD